MNTNLRIYLFIAMCVLVPIILFQCHLLLQSDGTITNGRTIVDAIQADAITSAPNIILWWTPFIGDLEYRKQCGNEESPECLFSENRMYHDHPNLKAILFYGSNLNVTDLPLPRRLTVPWILFHEESPKNVPFLSYASAISLFNWTATFSQYSNFPITLQYLDGVAALRAQTNFVSVSKKNELQTDDQLASVLYIQSICNTFSGRDEYVQELMKYINVDSYGKCLNNKELPAGLSGDDYLGTINSDEFYNLIARYKFVIAFENSVCDDYITEKLWRPLMIGVVPIYFGAPNVKSWLPNPKSAILISDFDSPRHLAEHLLYLNEEDAEYNSYLEHKLKSENVSITNQRLLDELNERDYETNSVVNDFECFVCDNLQYAKPMVADSSHYNCAKTVIFPKMEESVAVTPRSQSNWLGILHQGKCEADVLNYFVGRNQQFSSNEFEEELLSRYNRKICK